MEEQGDRGSPRAQILLVLALLVLGIGLFASSVLHEKGIWFEAKTARRIYLVLWSLAWLPGMVMSLILFLRRRRSSLVGSFLFQGLALALYWKSEEMLALAGGAGFFGLTFPFVMRPLGRSTGQKLGCILLSIGVPLYGYAATRHSSDWWTSGALLIVFLWMRYAMDVWPRFGKAVRVSFQEDRHRQMELRRRSKAYRWLERLLWMLVLAAAVSFILALGYLGLLWFRYK